MRSSPVVTKRKTRAVGLPFSALLALLMLIGLAFPVLAQAAGTITVHASGDRTSTQGTNDFADALEGVTFEASSDNGSPWFDL